MTTHILPCSTPATVIAFSAYREGEAIITEELVMPVLGWIVDISDEGKHVWTGPICLDSADQLDVCVQIGAIWTFPDDQQFTDRESAYAYGRAQARECLEEHERRESKRAGERKQA